MVLLKRVRWGDLKEETKDLHSNMVLLKLTYIHNIPPKNIIFTFQYGAT